MKKKIFGILITLALLGVTVFGVLPASADPPGSLDHVRVTPANATVNAGTTQQFTAKAFDAANVEIPGLTFTWTIIAGSGSIDGTGLFTAGATAGSFPIQASATQVTTTRVGQASMTVVVVGALDHVQVTPANAAVVAGATKQYAAKAFDAANNEITGLTFTWSVIAGGGTISIGGLFTAGTTAGPFPNTIQASTTQGAITRTGLASVTVPAVPAPVTTNRLSSKIVFAMIQSFVKTIGFDNFLGGQWSVKNGTAIDNIKVIPGVVTAVTDTSLKIIPNGQTIETAFTLATDTVILPKDAELKVNDKVVVVTVNDQVKIVVKITAPVSTTDRLPPGLKKHDKDRDEDKKVPPGWSKGKKNGWSKDRDDDDDD
jgi:hypothetical protein